MVYIPPVIYPKPPLPEINRTRYRLPKGQYVDQVVPKTGIVLHHTVSGSADSVYNWWLDKNAARVTRVATAYVVDKDGTIYEMFPDDRWAWHLGKGVSDQDEARTIGIEIVSEGGLVPVGGEIHSFFNPKTGRGVPFRQEMVDLGYVWRGYRYFDAYEFKQVLNVICLVDYLCDKYNIPRRMHQDITNYNESIKTFEGIFTHAQVRPDKTDVHPQFPVQTLANYTRLELL